MKFNELREYISIVDFAQHHGYSGVTPWAKSKRSRNYPALENTSLSDRIIINRNKNRYTEVGSTRSGDLIDFVLKRISTIAPHKAAMNEHAAVNEILHEYLNIAHELNPPKQKVEKRISKTHFEPILFIKSEKLREENIKYLQGAGISLSTINDPCFTGKIASIKNPIVDESGVFTGRHYRYYNVSFPYVTNLRGQTVGYEQRNFSFKGHALGSDKEAGLWISNVPAGGRVRNILIAESVKDCLSYHQLHQPKDTLYASCGGHVTLNQVATLKGILADLDIGLNPPVIVGFDNDLMGATFTMQLVCILSKNIGRLVSHHQDNSRLSLILPAPNKQLSKELNDFNKSIKSNPDYENNRFFSEVINDDFVIQIPKNKLQLQLLSESIIKSYKLTDISIQLPGLKDFNEDLQHKILVNQKLNHQTQKVKPSLSLFI